MTREGLPDFLMMLTLHIDITKLIDMKIFNTGIVSIPLEWRPIARVFTALGDENRQRILLLFDKGERLNVGRIASVSTLARSTVSHHLKILHDAGVLCSEKIGKEVWFWINRHWLEETLGNVLGYVRQNC
jgi:DNA-binding transcriptional ArsR family regulator